MLQSAALFQERHTREALSSAVARSPSEAYDELLERCRKHARSRSSGSTAHANTTSGIAASSACHPCGLSSSRRRAVCWRRHAMREASDSPVAGLEPGELDRCDVAMPSGGTRGGGTALSAIRRNRKLRDD